MLDHNADAERFFVRASTLSDSDTYAEAVEQEADAIDAEPDQEGLTYDL